MNNGLPPWGPTPSPRPRRAQQWRHRAALGGGTRQSPNRPIARRIRRRRERPGRHRVRRFRCGESAVSAPAESPPPSAVQVHAAAHCRGHWPFFIRRGAAAPRRRRGRPGRLELLLQRQVPLRCAAQPKPKAATAARAQAHADAIRGHVWEARGLRGGGEGGALRPPPHRPPPIPPASRPIPPRAACAVGACRRRSPIQRAGRQQRTQHTHGNGRPRRAPRRALLHRRVDV